MAFHNVCHTPLDKKMQFYGTAIRPESATDRQETEMAEHSERDLYAAGNIGDTIERLRLICLSRGANGFLDLGRVFRRMDKDGNKRLHKKEFAHGLKEMGMEITDDEIDKMFHKLDQHHAGRFTTDDFLVLIRPPLSELRLQVIDEVFNKIDKTGEGEISIEDLKHAYCVKSQPLYIAGEVSEESILATFLDHFKKNPTRDGKVTKEEFLNYYSGVSASIDDDCYFNLIMRQAYKL